MDNIKTIYCDFDGTITKKDAVNSFFELYADKKWVESEKLWVEGKISSQENAVNQVGMLKEVTPKELDEFINSIEVDDYFPEFIKLLKEKNIKFVILSDGFDLFIEKILQRLGLDDIEFYANHLVYKDNKFSIEFPYHNKACDIKAGMCKCARIKEKEFCYIGDGTSDLCVASKASLLFASKVLLQHCVTKNITHVAFENFRDIINIVKKI